MRLMVTKDGFAVVNDEARRIDVSDLPQNLEAIDYDSTIGEAMLYWKEKTTDTVSVRDLEGEKVENERRRENNKPILEDPLYKTVQVRRPPRRLNDPATLQKYIDRWTSAKPEPLPPVPPEIVAEQKRKEAEITDARQTTLGNVQPATIGELKAMDKVQFNAWFDANFTNAAQVIGLLKRIVFFLIRRVL